MRIIGKIPVSAGLIVACFFSGCATAPVVDLKPAPTVDIERYLGTWYEIARFDHWFEREMTQVKACYSKRKDGKISIVNTALKKDYPKIAMGTAKTTDVAGLLRVSFFTPFYSDYRILWIDEDYRHALVGGEDGNYLWILARGKKIEEPVKKTVLDEARRRGYDVSRLIWVKQ